MNLFTYGSLMFPEVWMRVVGTMHEHKPAVVTGFQRKAIKGVTYPCLIKGGKSECVEGVVYLGLSQRVLELLDDFEAHQYQRCTLMCHSESQEVEAEAYLWKLEYAHLIGGEWDLEWFSREGIQRFIAD